LEITQIISQTVAQKRVERDLMASEKRLNIIFESAPDAMYLNDSKGVFINGNKAAEELTGYKREELIGKSIFKINLLSKKDIFRAGKILARNIRELPTGPDEFTLLRKDRGTIDAEVRTFPVRIDNRLMVLGICRDITERKKAMEQLRESEEKFRVLAETSSDGIFTTDRSGKITYINPALERLFDISYEDALGTNFNQYITQSSAEKAVKILQDSGRKKFDVVRNVELTAVSKKGHNFAIEVSSSPIIKEGKVMGIECVVRDITQRKKAEEERTKLESLFHHSQKMEAIGTMAGGIAHDFNNILGVILGFSELALDNLEANHPVRKDIQSIYSYGIRARDLVRQILTFSRRTEIEHKPLNIEPIVKEALKFLRSSFPTTIKIESTIDQDLGYINANPSQIHQIIMNLSTNSLHAMEATGGILDVRLSKIKIGKKSTSTGNLDSGSYVKLSVYDTGRGMDKTTLSHIFEPFYTTKEVGKGTGLGLSVVHGIVESYKGAITVNSEPGKWTNFNIYFPVLRHEQKEKRSIEDAKTPRGHERILVVDDERPLADMYGQMLERWGYHTTIKTSPLEALKTFRMDPGVFDLVITDQTMPDMKGTELSQELLKIRPGIPIILTSGYGELISKEELSSSGIKIQYTKPVDIREFAKIMRKLLDKSKEII